MLLIGGWRAVVNGIYPPTPKEDPDFYRESVEVNGKEVWADMMDPRNAQMLSLVLGIVMMVAGLLWFLYFLQVWPFQPNGAEF